MSCDDENHDSRTILWCIPRSISTLFMKCLCFVEDTEVWFEPYFYCNCARVEYRRATRDEIPTEHCNGNEEVFQKVAAALETVFRTKFEPECIAYGSVRRRLEKAASKHVFVKDMGFCVPQDAYGDLLPRGYKHTFLIRDPLPAIHSYREIAFSMFQSAGLLQNESTHDNYDLERDDRYFTPGCFMKELYDLWMYVKENFNSDPVVIDADDFARKPKETLSAYCAAVGLPYSDSLMDWDAPDEDVAKKIRAPGDSMFDSDSFQRGTMSKLVAPSELPPRDQLTPDVIRCSERVVKYYQEMYEHRLKV